MSKPPFRPTVSNDEALAGDVIENLRLSLFEVFRVNLQRRGEMVVTGKTFRNCTLEGPCVLLPMGGTIEGCELGDAGGDSRSLFLVPAGPKVTGALAFAECTFEGCHFFNVGFTGTPEFLDTLLQSAAGGTP